MKNLTQRPPDRIIDDLFDGAPPAVSRREISRRLCGEVSPNTLAKLDCLGDDSIPGRFKIGRKVLYPTKNVINWLKNRASFAAVSQEDLPC